MKTKSSTIVDFLGEQSIPTKKPNEKKCSREKERLYLFGEKSPILYNS